MQLTKEDIKHMDTVGKHKDCDVIHLLTKGGCHMIVKKSKGGAFSVLASGAHRAIAKHQADQASPGIEWNEIITKSEDLNKAPKEFATMHVPDAKPEQKDTFGNPIYESNPQNHYDLAAFHSKVAGKHHAHEVGPGDVNGKMDRDMNLMHHTDTALKHYVAAGLTPKQAMDEHKKQMTYSNELPEGASAPFQGHALEMAWGKVNPGKRFPKGLPYDFK
jgi:hypothetical protein